MEYVHHNVVIPVGDEGQTSGILSSPLRDQKSTAVIVAHGAGNDMNTPLLQAFSGHLAESGYHVLRFNFLYTERGKKAPDRKPALVKTWAAAFSYAGQVLGGKTQKWVAAGKSMGGRIASEMAAEGILPVNRLIFLGYPLHPAGKSENLRDAHLYGIQVPMLFFAGTRDQLCDMQKLQTVLKKVTTPAELYVIEGGDHSFKTPRSLRRTEEDVFADISRKSVEWLGD